MIDPVQRYAAAKNLYRNQANWMARFSQGYTLLELILALALSVLLLSGVSMAINYHLVTLQEQQREIEKTQVARQTLMLITKDLRAAIQYKPIESTALEELIESVSAAAAVADALDPDATEDTEDSEPAESAYQATRPGLYGSSTQLQVDVSRLPRKDQYNVVLFSDGTKSDIPSDVKTVSYFVRSEATDADSSNPLPSSSNRTGLIRVSVDRATARYAQDYSSPLALEDYEEVLAEEITAIQFRYWDSENEEWLDEWNSDEKLGLPTAIEIGIALGTFDEEADETDDRSLYRSVVYLPIAEVIVPEEPGIDEATEEGTGASLPDTGGLPDVSGLPIGGGE